MRGDYFIGMGDPKKTLKKYSLAEDVWKSTLQR